MPDPIKDLYNSVKSNGLFVDESDFRSQLAKSPKEVYSTVSDLFVDYNDFENVLGFKKKVGGTVSQTLPSQSQSILAQVPEKFPLGVPGQVPYNHSDEVFKARQKVQSTLEGSDDIYGRVVREDRVNLFEQQQRSTPTMDGFVNPAAQKVKRDLLTIIPVTQEDITTKKQEVIQNPVASKEILRRAAKKDPEIAKSAYLVDSEDRVTKDPLRINTVVDNANKIASGELTYDIKSGRLQKPEGVLTSTFRGIKERNRQIEDYDFLTKTLNDNAIISQLEADMKDYDPDKPTPVPEGGAAGFGQMLGMEGIAMAKGAGSAILTSMIPGAQPAAPFVAAFAASPEYYKRGYSTGLRQAYYEQRQKGVPEMEALSVARKQAESEANLSAAEGIASGFVGARIGLKPTSLNVEGGFKNAVSNVVKSSGNFIKENLPEGLADASVAGGLQVAKNIEAINNGLDRGVFDDVQDNVAGELGFAIGLGVLTKAAKLAINPKSLNTIVTGIAQQPKEVVDAKLGEMVVNGMATPKEVVEAGKKIEEARALNSQIPQEITDEESRADIAQRIKIREDLKKQLSTANEVFHDDIKQKIKDVDQDIINIVNTQRNAINESQIQVTGTESNISQPQGIVQGQPEVGQGSGIQGQVTQPQANVSDSNIGGQGQVAIPFEITTYIQGKHKEDYDAAVNRLVKQGNTVEDANTIVTDAVSKALQLELPSMMKEVGIQSDMISVTPSEGGYTNTESGKYDFSPNIMITMDDNSSVEDVDAVMKAANTAADQQSANAFMNATEEEINVDGPDIHGVFIFDRPQQMSKQDFSNMMFELHGIKDSNGNDFLTGHSDFGKNLIGIGGHFYGKQFSAEVEKNLDKINSILSKYGVNLSSTDLIKKKVLTYERGAGLQGNTGTLQGETENIGRVQTKSERLVEKAKDLYSRAIQSVGSNATIEQELRQELSGIDKALDTSIESATASLKKAGINFLVVDSSKGEGQARGQQAIFVSEDGTVFIDKAKLSSDIEAGLVVWHEASHPVMNIIRNTNKPLYDSVVRGLKKAAKTNDGVFDALDWAKSQPQYDNVDTQNDEAIVETIGRINAGLIDIKDLDTGLRQKLIDFVNSIAKFFGIDPILNDTDLAAFKKTVSEVADALKTGRDIGEIVGRENATEIQSQSVQARANEVFDGILEKIGINLGTVNEKTGKKKVTNFDVAKAMNEYYKKLFKTLRIDDFGNKALEAVSDHAAEEVVFGIQKFGNNSGKGWYTVDYSKALDIMKAFDPDIVNNPDIKEVATAVIAISSNSTDVYTNLTRVIYAIDQFKKTGKVPTDIGVGKGMSAIASSVSVYNNLIDLFGSVSDLKDFMQTVRPVSEAKKALIEKSGLKSWAQVMKAGLGTDPEWNESEVLPTSVILFGPKIGAFYSNLSGLGGTPTIDRWCIRTMYRYRGDMKAKALPSEINDFIAANKLEGQSKGSVMATIQDHAKMFNAILTGRGEFKGQSKEERNERLKPYRKGSQIWTKMSGVVNEIEDGLTDKIDNKAQYARDFRSFTKRAFEKVQQKVKEKVGEDLTISDIQAVLWIYEKELFGALGVKQRPESTYSASAQRLLNEMESGKFTLDQMKAGKVTGEPDVTEEGSMGDSYGMDAGTFEEGISNQPNRLKEPIAQASVGNRDILNKSLSDKSINSVRASLRKKAPDSTTLQYLDELQDAKKNDDLVNEGPVADMLTNGVSINDIASMLINDGIFKDASQARKYLNNIGGPDGAGIITQASVGNRSEEDLRAPGEGKERDRALSSKFGDLNPETQAKIDDDAVTYFQRPNKQTAKAVEEFIDGQNLIDMADYVLSNPDIPEVSKVWMAAEVAKRMNAEIAAAKSAEDQNLVDALTDKQSAIYNEFAKQATSLGQAVQAFIAFKQDPNAVEFFLPKVLRQLKKAGVDNVTDVQRGEIVNLLKDVNSAADGLPKDKAIIKLSHYLASIAPMKPIDVLKALWYAKILSGVTTQATNFFANVFNTAFELPAVGLRIALKTGNPMAVVAGIKGFGSGVFKGAVSASDIVKSGVRSKEVDKYFSESPLEYFTWSKWLGEKGKVLDNIPPLNFGAWKYVGRLLSATDALFSTANQEAIANMLAYAEASGAPGNNNFKKAQTILGNSKQNIADAKAQAIAEGFDPKTQQGRRRVIEIVAQKRGEKITTEADAIGKRITLNYTPEGWTKPLYDAVVGLQKSVPAIKMVIPFARIVANLTENALNYTPAGLAKAVTGARDPFSGMKNKLTADERADLFAKFAIGMGALAVAATKMGEDDDDWFEITAGGSPDVQKRYELQKGGWRPYTITLKDGSKISYKDWPIAGVLAGLGHIRDAKKYSFDDSTQMGLYAYGFFLNFYDKSLLSGLQDFFGLFNVSAGRGKYAPESKASERLEKYAAQQVKSVALSNLAQQTGRLYSELVTGNPQRDAKTFSEILYKDIPVMNDGIRPIIDVFGEPVKYNTTERLKPIYSTESEKVIKWLNENKLFVGVPQKKNIINADGSERPMTDQEYYEYRKLAGQKSKDWINKLISGIENENIDISDAFFQSSIDAARDLAYIEVLTKYGFK